MSPSNSVTVSELSLGIELLYNIVSVQQYALAQKSLSTQTLCLKTMLQTLCSTQRFQHAFGQKKCATSALRTIPRTLKDKSLIYIDNW